MALAVYVVTALALLALWQRMQRVSRAAAIVLVLLPLTFTGRALFTNRVYAPIDLPFTFEPLKSMRPGVVPHDIALSDLHCQIIPWQQAVRASLARGEWPLWNPSILCGDILAAAAQPAVYDPFHWIALLLPLPLALTFGASITFFLAGFFTFAFARSHGRSELASLVAAAAFMFGGMMAFYVGWPLARSWAYLPFVLFAVRRVVREQKAGALVCAFALLIVAGHPESVLHVVAVGLAYGVYQWGAAALGGAFGGPGAAGAPPAPLRPIVLAIGAGVVALALTAVYLLPFLEAAPQTLEHEIRRTLYAPAPYHLLLSDEIRSHRIQRTFLPYVDGQPWRGPTSPQWDPLSARAGSIVLALAIAAIFAVPKRGETWFFAGLGIICFGATFGTWPIGSLLHALPLFDIAINERLAFAAVLAMAMLAAIAIDAMNRSALVAMIAVLAALGIAMYVKPPIALAELIPLALAIALARTRVAAPAILALLLVQRTLVDGGIYPALPREMFYPPLAQLPKSGDRIVGINHTLIPNGATMYGLEDVRGYEAMTFKRLADTYALWSKFQPAWFNIVSDPSRPFLSFLNVRWILDGATVAENPHALPRAFVPRRVQYVRDNPVEAMKSATDFADLAWIETQSYEPHEAPNGPGRVSIRREGSAFELDADMQGGGWIVISETAWKGWRAYLDNRRVQTHFANHAFLGVHVPAGRHRLRLVYLPESFTRGRAISLVTALLLAAARTRRLLRRRPA